MFQLKFCKATVISGLLLEEVTNECLLSSLYNYLSEMEAEVVRKARTMQDIDDDTQERINLFSHIGVKQLLTADNISDIIHRVPSIDKAIFCNASDRACTCVPCNLKLRFLKDSDGTFTYKNSGQHDIRANGYVCYSTECLQFLRQICPTSQRRHARLLSTLCYTK